MKREEIQKEFDAFFEFTTADKSVVTSTSAILFAERIAQLSGLVIQLGERLVQIERRLNDMLEKPMTDQEIRELLNIKSNNTLRTWRKFKDFPEYATRQNVMDWYGHGHGKGRKAA